MFKAGKLQVVLMCLRLIAMFVAHISLAYCMISNYCIKAQQTASKGLPTILLIHVDEDVNISQRPNQWGILYWQSLKNFSNPPKYISPIFHLILYFVPLLSDGHLIMCL